MNNVLVFPCGSEIGLEIYRSFKGVKDVNLIGGSSVPDHGMFVYQNYIGTIPQVDDPNFIKSINQLIQKYHISHIFPAHDSVILKLAENFNLVKSTVITSPYETCMICRSKKKTYQYLKNIIKTPIVYDKNKLSKGSYPYFLKPEVGQGTKGVFLAKDKKELLFYLKKDPTLLILEYLPGEEFTVDCFTDFNGKLKFVSPRKRNRILNGISVNTFLVKGKEFKAIANKINDNLKINGAWFYQVKRDKNGELTLLEIAPRIAGSMAIQRVSGVNLPVLSYLNSQGLPVDIRMNRFDVTFDRALENSYKTNLKYKNVYLDFDDCLLEKDQINLDIVKFVFQCKNHKINVHLISKHKYDLQAKLKELGIKELFSSIIHIKKIERKVDYITKMNSIFIDDSFSERRDVYDKLKIPVFSVDAIECLLK